MGYVDEVLEVVKKKNADQPEFLQAVTEVLDSLRPVIDANEDLYRKNAILERITEPDRQIMFRVPWVDDNGQVQVTKECVELGLKEVKPWGFLGDMGQAVHDHAYACLLYTSRCV